MKFPLNFKQAEEKPEVFNFDTHVRSVTSNSAEIVEAEVIF
jgi:hypothetical protein